jgi:hypothetical protein
MLLFYNVWKHMRKLTGKDIEKRAVMELIMYFETLIDKVIIQSNKELEQLNSQRKIQGLYEKSRIDAESLRRAIKNLNALMYPSSSEMTGGLIQQESEKNVEHTPEKKDLGVEII